MKKKNIKMKDKEIFIKNIFACAIPGKTDIEVTIAGIEQDSFYHIPSKQLILGYANYATIEDLSHFGAIKVKTRLENLPMTENLEDILHEALGSKYIGGNNLDFDSRAESFPGLYKVVLNKAKLMEYAHKNNIFLGDIDDAFYFKDKQFYVKTVTGAYEVVNFSKVGGDKGNTLLLLFTLVGLLKQKYIYESDGFVSFYFSNDDLLEAVIGNISLFPELKIKDNDINYVWHKHTKNNLLNKKIPEVMRPLIKHEYLRKAAVFKFGIRLPQF